MERTHTTESVEKSLAAFHREKRRMPTYTEMMALLGVQSKSVVSYWVRKLLDRGIVAKDEKGFLKPACKTFGLPMLGHISAGFPSPAEEELRDIISFDDYLVTRPASSFLVTVTGDSMTGAGIMEGDLIIVERGRNPKNGDIVLAEVDGEWTLKRFKKQGREIVLEAENAKYPPIRPKTELKVSGVVSAVVRKYHL